MRVADLADSDGLRFRGDTKAARGRAGAFEHEQMIFRQRRDIRLRRRSGDNDRRVIGESACEIPTAPNILSHGCASAPLTWNVAPLKATGARARKTARMKLSRHFVIAYQALTRTS